MKEIKDSYRPDQDKFSDREIKKMLDDQQLLQELAGYPDFNLHKAGSAINRRLGKSILQGEIRNRRLSLLKYAAVFITLFLAGYAYYFFVQPISFHNDGVVVQGLILPDNSEVLLGQGASLSYTRAFSIFRRNVNLIGNAFFNVQHLEAGPFKVYFNEQEVEVLGTEFFIDQSVGHSFIQLVEGNIVYKSNNDNKVQLQGGEKLNISTGEVEIIKSEQDENNELIPEVVLIDNWTVSEAVEMINDYYGRVILQLNDETAANCNIHTRFRPGQLDEFIEELELIFKIKLRSYKGSFAIDEINCNS